MKGRAMPIFVSCPSCGGKFSAQDNAAGKKATCPKCGAAILVPVADEPQLTPLTEVNVEFAEPPPVRQPEFRQPSVQPPPQPVVVQPIIIQAPAPESPVEISYHRPPRQRGGCLFPIVIFTLIAIDVFAYSFVTVGHRDDAFWFAVPIVDFLARTFPKQTKSADLQTAAQVVCVVTSMLILGLLYFAPTLTAIGRKHPNTRPIFVINLLLGWTLAGWVIAAAWSLMAIERGRERRYYD
jgi:hypothetical protein